jgi:hypothetical protein
MRRALLFLAALFLAGWAFAGAVVSAPDVLLDVLLDAHAEDAVYRNAMYLYLRVAGLAWIAVEWVAAVVLWRAYRMLRTRVEDA